jgi:septum formation protein
MSLLVWLDKFKSGEIKLVLGSASNPRRAVVGQLGIPFEIVVSDFAEDLNKDAFDDPRDYPLATSMEKTKDIVRKLAQLQVPIVLVTCDTVVIRDGHIIEKPESSQHAFDMIKSLSGQNHSVVTGVVVSLIGRDHSVHGQTMFKTESIVQFVSLTDQQIRAYIETQEPLGKSGGYGIQGLGEILIKEVRGSFSNVVGLPLHEVCEAIAQILDSNKSHLYFQQR